MILSNISIKDKIKNYTIIIGGNLCYNKNFPGYLHFQIGCGFAEYDLFKPSKFYIKLYIYEFSYEFDRVVY